MKYALLLKVISTFSAVRTTIDIFTRKIISGWV